MPYTKTTWTDRVVAYPLTFNLQKNADGTTTLIPAEGAVSAQGTPLTATNFNNIENYLASIAPTIDTAITGTSARKMYDARSSTQSVGAGATLDYTWTYPVAFGTSPTIQYSLYNTDVNGLYTTASGIYAVDNTKVVIRIINKGSTLQYYFIHLIAVGT